MEERNVIQETVSHYRILSKIGEGGMGVVYLAEDTHLGRRVALKFLHERVAASKEGRIRFMREAQAAGSLDHSNICHIYDFDEVDGRVFLAMPYIEGESLAHRIRDHAPLPAAEAVRIATQLCAALSEAHRHGIIHRDVKPSNVILTRDGSAKLLDFGLASLLDQTQITRSGDTPGTVAYMSPEQARGENVGTQTDIWSLGVVLYEMLTRKRPLMGEGVPAMLNAVIHGDVPRLGDDLPGAAPELEWICARALNRDVSSRYASAEEMYADLRAIDLSRDVPGSISPPSWTGRVRYPRWLVAAVGATIAVLLYFAFRDNPGPNPATLAGRPTQVTTDLAWEGAPCISPDGSRIAYARDTGGQLDLYVIASRGGSPLRLTDNPADDTDPYWLPDGSGILFTSDRSGLRSIWKSGLHGEGQALLVENAEYPAASPDGTRLAFARAGSSGRLHIFVAAFDALEAPRQLTDESHGLWSHSSPAWSPDGKQICYATAHDLWTVTTDGAHSRALTSDGVADSEPVWSTDGRWIYFSSFRENTLALWRIRSTGGTAERLTLGSGPESHPSISESGSCLVYTTQRQDEDVVVRNLARGTLYEVTGLDEDYQPAVSDDGTMLAFVSDRWDGTNDIWLQDLDTGEDLPEPRRLTRQNGSAAMPSFSPDGKWLAYYRILGKERDIWTIHIDEGAPIRLTTDPAADVAPVWSPDGSRIAFVSERSGSPALWIADVVEGRLSGEPRRLTRGSMPVMSPTWSADGRSIAFISNRDGRNQPWLVSIEDPGTPRLLYENVSLHDLQFVGNELWLSGKFDADHVELKAIDPATGTISVPVPDFTFPTTHSWALFDASADGTVLTYSRARLEGDIWALFADPGTF